MEGASYSQILILIPMDPFSMVSFNNRLGPLPPPPEAKGSKDPADSSAEETQRDIFSFLNYIRRARDAF